MCKGVVLHMGVGSHYPELADSFFSCAVIFSFKACCQHLSGRLHGAAFSGGGLGADKTGGSRTKRRRSDRRDGDFTLQRWRI